MTISYDFWLLASSCVLAVAGCLAACVLVGQLHTGRGPAWAWIAIAAPVLGLALWAMQFTALMAVRLPMGFAFDLPLTLFSIEPAVVATAVVLWLGRNGRLQGARLLGAVLALAAGATATRYFGLAAMRIIPGIQYDAIIFVAAIAASAAIAYFALHYAGRWISGASLSGSSASRRSSEQPCVRLNISEWAPPAWSRTLSPTRSPRASIAIGSDTRFHARR
jgi:diguanylate cyclase